MQVAKPVEPRQMRLEGVPQASRAHQALRGAARARAQGADPHRKAAAGGGGGPRLSGSYVAFTVPPGKVRLDAMDDVDWARQLAAFLRTYGRTGSANFARKISEETLRNRTDILFSTYRLLHGDRRIETLSQMRPRLLPRMFELWTGKGVGKRAQINYFNVMRWFWRVCGIEIKAIADYATTPGEFTIQRAAEHDKSWTGNGVDFDDVVKKIAAIDPVAARLFTAMKTYGLRAKESLRLQPHEADGGSSLDVTKGSKTGRPRQIHFAHFGEEQMRAVLDELKDQVPAECHLAWQNRSLKQAKTRLYTLCRRVGLTKAQLGVTMHGLRHEWAIDQLERLANVKAPVRGGMTLNYRELSGVRRLISEGLGHYRAWVTSAYYGSFVSLQREQLKRFEASWEKLEIVLEDVGKLLVTAGIHNLYWYGSRALGINRGRLDPFEFLFGADVPPDLALELAPKIAEAVAMATGLDCTVNHIAALPAARRLQWETEAVPLFAAVPPLDRGPEPGALYRASGIAAMKPKES